MSRALETADGEAYWGVKAGFRDYIAGLPDGACWTSPEAQQAPDGRFVFPVSACSGGAGVLSLAGGVHFSGHGGALQVSLVGLALCRPTQREWELSAEHPGGRGSHVLATGAAVATSERGVRVALRLAPAGVSLFDGSYPVGAYLDELEIVFSGPLRDG